MKLSVILMGAIALLLSVAVGFLLFMNGPVPKADTSRLLQITEFVGMGAVVTGLISALIFTVKAHRNPSSYLKAFIVLSLLQIWVQYGDWNKKFHGPEKPIRSADGKYVVDVPSDWATMKDGDPNASLKVMDWAATRWVTVNPAGVLPAEDPAVALDQVRESVYTRAGARFGQPTGDFQCGHDCKGKTFRTVTDNRAMRVYLVVKADGSDLMLVSGGVMESVDNKPDQIPALIGTARMVH